jgi:hypothetical protein
MVRRIYRIPYFIRRPLIRNVTLDISHQNLVLHIGVVAEKQRNVICNDVRKK